jgi:hypothetical protein
MLVANDRRISIGLHFGLMLAPFFSTSKPVGWAAETTKKMVKTTMSSFPISNTSSGYLERLFFLLSKHKFF